MGARVYAAGARVYASLFSFSVSPSPFGLDFGTLDFGLGLDKRLSSIIFEYNYYILGCDAIVTISFWSPI